MSAAPSPPVSAPAGAACLVQRLEPGLAMISSTGANVLVSHGDDGTYVFDCSLANSTDVLLREIAAIAEKPIRLLVTTHWHHDHTGGNERFGQSRIPILAHAATRERMANEQYLGPLDMRIPPAPPAARPTLTFEGSMKIHANGDTVRLIHLPAAHTDGDLVAFWEAANVLLAGDFYVPEEDLPFVDYDAGGNFCGFIDAVETLIELCDDHTRIVPGHDRTIATRADLERFRDRLAELEDIVRQARVAGATRETIAGDALFAGHYRGGLFEPAKFARMILASLEDREATARGTSSPEAPVP